MASSGATAPAAQPQARTPAPAAAAAAAGGGRCDIVSSTEAATALGLPAFEAPEAQVIAPVTLCTFRGEKRKGVMRDSLIVRFESGRTVSDFALIRQGHDRAGEKTVTYSGLGDAAATFSFGTVQGITFLTKGTVIMLSCSHVTSEQIVALAKTIATRF
jgi:hypothetical protein